MYQCVCVREIEGETDREERIKLGSKQYSTWPYTHAQRERERERERETHTTHIHTYDHAHRHTHTVFCPIYPPTIQQTCQTPYCWETQRQTGVVCAVCRSLDAGIFCRSKDPIQTHRQTYTERQTQRDTERQRQRQRQIDRYTCEDCIVLVCLFVRMKEKVCHNLLLC